MTKICSYRLIVPIVKIETSLDSSIKVIKKPFRPDSLLEIIIGRHCSLP